MTRSEFHRRGDVLRAVIEEADARQDGILPTYVDGVRETFRDDLDLVAALLLRWSARLSGNLERAQAEEPMDLESAVVEAWAQTAAQNPGLRAVLDEAHAHPADEAMATALTKARRKAWVNLALMAGLSSTADARGAATGRRIEERARLVHAERTPLRPAVPAQRTAGTGAPAASGAGRFVARLKAAMSAA